MKAFALRSLRRELHNRSTLFWTLGAPLLWFALFGVAVGNSGPTERAGMAVAFGIFGTLSATLISFSGFLIRDLRDKRYRKLRSLPVSVSADLAGRFLAGAAMGIVSFGLVIAAGVVTGGNFLVPGPLEVGVVALALLLFTMVGAAVAIFVVVLVREPERVNSLTSAGTFALFIATGYNGLNPGILPESVQWLVNVVPNALATRIALGNLVPAASESALTPPAMPTGPAFVGLLVAYAVVLSVGAVFVGRKLLHEGEVGER